ncbi:MAG: TolC family protein [Cyclobacteriaceae bacterium]|nr:TolC family protein [Cyclobacteriaceae bacterium]
MKCLFLFFIVPCAALQVHAQTVTLTLEEALKVALENNITIKKEQNNLLAARSAESAAKYNLGPAINANINAGRVTGNSFNQQEGQVINGTTDYLSGTLNASIVIYNGMSKVNTLKSYQQQFQAQQYLVEYTKQQVMNEVAKSYLLVLRNQEQQKIAQENLKFQNTSLEKIKTEVGLGSKPQVDEFNQISLVRNAELLVLRAGIELKNSKSSLLIILRMNPSVELTLVEPKMDMDGLPSSPGTYETLIEIALGNRKDLKGLEKLEQYGRYEMMISKASFLPQLSAFAGMGSRYNNIHGLNNRAFDQQFFNDNTYMGTGLSLFIPIFNGMSSRASLVRAKMFYENKKTDRENAEFTISSEVIQAHQNYHDAILNYQLSLANMEAAEAAYRLNVESFELGISGLLDFSQANKDYYQAKSDMVGAKYTLLFQDIFLKSTLGTLEP